MVKLDEPKFTIAQLNSGEALAGTRIPLSTVKRLFTRGELGSVFIGGRRYVTATHLADYLARNEIPARKKAG